MGVSVSVCVCVCVCVSCENVCAQPLFSHIKLPNVYKHANVNQTSESIDPESSSVSETNLAVLELANPAFVITDIQPGTDIRIGLVAKGCPEIPMVASQVEGWVQVQSPLDDASRAIAHPEPGSAPEPQAQPEPDPKRPPRESEQDQKERERVQKEEASQRPPPPPPSPPKGAEIVLARQWYRTALLYVSFPSDLPADVPDKVMLHTGNTQLGTSSTSVKISRSDNNSCSSSGRHLLNVTLPADLSEGHSTQLWVTYSARVNDMTEMESETSNKLTVELPRLSVKAPKLRAQASLSADGSGTIQFHWDFPASTDNMNETKIKKCTIHAGGRAIEVANSATSSNQYQLVISKGDLLVESAHLTADVQIMVPASVKIEDDDDSGGENVASDKMEAVAQCLTSNTIHFTPAAESVSTPVLVSVNSTDAVVAWDTQHDDTNSASFNITLYEVNDSLLADSISPQHALAAGKSAAQLDWCPHLDLSSPAVDRVNECVVQAHSRSFSDLKRGQVYLVLVERVVDTLTARFALMGFCFTLKEGLISLGCFVCLVGWFGWLVWLVGLVGWFIWLVGLVGWFGWFGWLVWLVGLVG